MKWLRDLFASKAHLPKPDHAAFRDRLESLGFFRHCPPDQLATVRAALLTSGWSGVFAHPGRFFPADAEDLAEGGIPGFLESVAPFLAREGVPSPEIEDRFSDRSYTMKVAGREHTIYGELDLQREEREPGRLWAIATVRTFSIVNDLLVAAGSEERLYAVNGGNDLFGLFLTPPQFAEIVAYAGADLRGAPYEVRDEPPSYGARE